MKIFNFYSKLPRFLRSYNTQAVTNDYLKCYEIIDKMGLISENKNGKQLNVFFNAELPGSFVAATNH